MDCVGVAAKPRVQCRSSTPTGARHSKGRCETSPVPEHRPLRKRRRCADITYVQRNGTAGKQETAVGDGQSEALVAQTAQTARTGRAVGEQEGGPATLERLPTGFAEDYFSSTLRAKVNQSALALAAEAPGKTSVSENPAGQDDPAGLVASRGRSWLEALQMGFSLLLEGVGSKWRVLEAFAESILLPWGAAVVRINAFHARFSLAECLREVLEQLCLGAGCLGPGANSGSGSGSGSASVEVLASSLRASLPGRPLCFVVHNLEMLPPAHQECLARLASSRHVHLVASVDSLWAGLCWSPRCLRHFNFLRQELHSRDGGSTRPEAAARFPSGTPAWCDARGAGAARKEQRASMGVVLASLTNSHRELVQLLAQMQLDTGTGCPRGRLLEKTSDRMIATTLQKLQKLLNEFKDHKVVATRWAADGTELYYLNADERTLRQLARDGQLEESDGEESNEQ